MTPAAAVDSATTPRRREEAAGLTLLLGLAVLAILAPCLAGSRPLIALSSAGVYAPALRDVLRPLPHRFAPPTEGELGARWRIMPPIPHDPLGDEHTLLGLHPPDAAHWLGTDASGRDVLARLIHGARPSLLVAFIATILSLVIGVPIGAVAGYAGRRWDLMLSRLIEASLSFPALVLLLLLTALWLRSETPGAPDVEARAGASLLVVGMAVAAVRWAVVARYTRAEVMRLARSDLAIAARAAGAAGPRVLFRHIVPCAMGPVVVSAAFGAGSAVIAEASLSFLGVGLQPPWPTWGQMVAEGCGNELRAWWLVAFPGAMVAVTVAAFNLLGEGLRRPRIS